jgi:RNA polymerase primary sigma factor
MSGEGSKKKNMSVRAATLLMAAGAAGAFSVPSRRLDHAILSRAAEAALARRARDGGDSAARDALVSHNQRLVARIAWRLEHRGVPVEDLVQEGNCGLLAAIERFDPDRGTKLSTFAAHYVRGYMHRAIDKHSRAIRIPSYLRERRRRIARARAEALRTTGGVPSIEQLAVDLGLHVWQIDRADNIPSVVASLDGAGVPVATREPADELARM